MKRVVYYVIHCTSEENQNGVFHYSKPLVTLSAARTEALKQRKKFGQSEGHIAIEKHHEVFEHFEWRLDHESGGSEYIDYI